MGEDVDFDIVRRRAPGERRGGQVDDVVHEGSREIVEGDQVRAMSFYRDLLAQSFVLWVTGWVRATTTKHALKERRDRRFRRRHRRCRGWSGWQTGSPPTFLHVQELFTQILDVAVRGSHVEPSGVRISPPSGETEHLRNRSACWRRHRGVYGQVSTGPWPNMSEKPTFRHDDIRPDAGNTRSLSPLLGLYPISHAFHLRRLPDMRWVCRICLWAKT